ncbi:MAG: hypothetical protein ABI679_11255 [Gemmatimonadota bacterium]
MRTTISLPSLAALLVVAACSNQATPTTTPGPASTTPGSGQPMPATTAQGTEAGVTKNEPDSNRQDILDHSFTIPAGENIRVFLTGGSTYRAELTGSGIRLQLRPVDQSIQTPLVEELVPGTGAGGTSIFTIRPRQDGDYEIRTIGGDPGLPLTVRLTKQAAPSH